MRYFLRLIRWKNLLILIYILLTLRYCILESFFKLYDLQLRLTNVNFLMLLSAVIFIAAAGYIINDYLDITNDQINEKDPVIGYYIKSNIAIYFYIIFSLIGIILGTLVSFNIGYPKFSLIFFITASLLWFYSSSFKKSFLLGNLIIAFLSASIPLLILIYDLLPIIQYFKTEIIAKQINIKIPQYWLLGYAAFAFIYTFIREVIKDQEDIIGDKKMNYNTLAIVIGVPGIKILTSLLLLISTLALIWIFLKFLNITLSIIYLIIFLVIPNLLTIFLIIKAQNKKHYHSISIFLKIIMFLGISYSLLVCYIFNTL